MSVTALGNFINHLRRYFLTRRDISFIALVYFYWHSFNSGTRTRLVSLLINYVHAHRGWNNFLYFILRSLSFPYPIVEFRLFKHLYFCFALLNVALLFSAYFGMVILLSLWLKLYVNYTPDWIILLIGTMALGAWIPIFLNYKRFDARVPLATALLFLLFLVFILLRSMWRLILAELLFRGFWQDLDSPSFCHHFSACL